MSPTTSKSETWYEPFQPKLGPTGRLSPSQMRCQFERWSKRMLGRVAKLKQQNRPLAVQASAAQRASPGAGTSTH